MEEKKYGAVASGISEWLPFLLILLAYSLKIFAGYAYIPVRSDEISYALVVQEPWATAPNIFFRHFNFYFAKLFTPFFLDTIETTANVSFLAALGVVGTTYLIIRTVASQTAAILGAVLVSTFPTLIYQATWFGADLACLFWGQLALLFAVRKYVGKGRAATNCLLSGFCMIGAIFSKEAAICYVIPIALLMLPGATLKQFGSFMAGFALAFLFMAICDGIWAGDFFYHLNPDSYWAYLNGFNGRFDAGVAKSMNKWNATFVQTQSEMPWLLMYFFGAVVFIAINKGRSTQRYAAFCVVLVGIISIFLRDGVLVRFNGVTAHPRFMLTMVIPVFVGFAMLLPINEEKTRAWARGIFSFNLFASLFFMVVFYFGTHPGYFHELRSEWTLHNGLIHVFSFWVFLFAFGFVLYERVRESSKLHRHVHIVSAMGLLILIGYSALWGNIMGRYEVSRRGIGGRIGKYETLGNAHAKYSEKLLIAELAPAGRELEDYIYYAYMRGMIEKRDDWERLKREFRVGGEHRSWVSWIDSIANGDFEYILTASDLETLNSEGAQHRLSFTHEVGIYGGNIFKINRM